MCRWGMPLVGLCVHACLPVIFGVYVCMHAGQRVLLGKRVCTCVPERMYTFTFIYIFLEWSACACLSTGVVGFERAWVCDL